MKSTGARVLYIDDDPGLCRLVQKDLERNGYVVETASDGVSGAARVAQGGIDVVVLDHIMANQDGLETLAVIRGFADSPPVIYVTAMQEVSVAVAALKAGARDYVAKDARGEFVPLLRRAINAAFEAVALRRGLESVEAESRRNWHLTQSIVDTIRDPLVVLEHDMTIVTASKTFLTIFGITEAETRGRRLSELGQRQWDVPAFRFLMEKVLPENKPIEGFEIEDDFPGLGRRVFNLNARKIFQPGNHAHRMLLVFEDITDRKQRERDAEMLQNEISHRIKNNLQIIVGLIGYEAKLTPDANVAGYKAMQARIGAIAELYDLISHSSRIGAITADAYLRGIAKTMSATLLGDASNIKIEVEAEALDIDPNKAVPFGLLVNELATNAVKHAFPDGVGRVVLSVKHSGDNVALTVSDNGIGIETKDTVTAKTPERRGFNYVTIFVRQLGGTIAVSPPDGSGTTVSIVLPRLGAPTRAESARAAA